MAHNGNRLLASALEKGERYSMRQAFPCPRCGSEIKMGQRFCGTCGQQFEYRCQHCGATFDEVSKFCISCGARLNWPREQEPKPTQGTSEHPSG